MTTPSPWEPPPGSPAAMLAATDPIYRALWTTLNFIATDTEAPVAAAAIAAVDLGADLMITSGQLWRAPDFPAALRRLADSLEQRREAEPAPPLLETVRETLASSAPPLTN